MPCGTYRVYVQYSRRYKQSVPYIFLHKRSCKFHVGSKPKDATGIIVGKNANPGWIEDSESILQALTRKLQRAIQHGESVMLVIR